MTWIFITLLILFIFAKFFRDFDKDNYDLQSQSLDEKFGVIVNMINQHAFKGLGTISKIDKREFNLYQDMQNQIIHFLYGTGNLTITWRYKYFQKEVVNERQFDNVRNLSLFEQQKIGEQIIREMDYVIEQHRNKVISNI
jgi:hypothetical protein